MSSLRLRDYAPILAAGMVSLLAFAIRLYRADDPLGGFHAFNEGFYLAQAQGYMERGLASAFSSPGDYNNPPLYSLLVAMVFRLFGVSVVAARAVSAAFSALGTMFVYGLAAELYDRKAGVLAALAFALMPGAVLLGHNVQVDSMMIALTTGAVFLFVRAIRMSSTWTAAAAGLLLGAAVFAKITAVLALPALLVWAAYRERGSLGAGVRRSAAALVALLVVATPWYAVQLVSSGDAFLASQRGLAATIDLPDVTFLTKYFIIELMWMVSPLLFAVLLVFFATSVGRRGRGDLLIWLLLLANGAFYLLYHYHTYYLLTLAPLSAVAVGRTLTFAGAGTWKRVAAVGAPLAVLLLIFSFATMAALKYGDSGLTHVDEILDREAPDAPLLATGGLIDNGGPAVTFHSRRDVGRFGGVGPDGIIDTQPEAAVLDYRDEWGLELQRPYELLPRSGVRMVILGIGFYPLADWAHGFTLNSVEVERVEGGPVLGLQEYKAPAAYVLWLPRPEAQNAGD